MESIGQYSALPAAVALTLALVATSAGVAGAQETPAPAEAAGDGADEEMTFTLEEVQTDPTFTGITSGLAGGQRPELDPERPDRYVLRPPKSELSFVGIYFARMTTTNIAVANPLRTGQVAGRLFGSNESTTVDDSAWYVEQRMLGFLTYAPKLLNEKARLRAGFEVDFIYGDASNGVGANVGGGVNGDQVNLQTKRMAIEAQIVPGWYGVLGLQALTDSVHDPEKTDPNVLLHSGYHLGFWGTDAAGAALYGKVGEWLEVKVAGYGLWENVPHKADDVWLAQADAAVRVAEDWWVGASAWTLRDQGNGASGYGLRSPIARGNGAAVLLQNDVDYDYDAQLAWLGLNVARNSWFKFDRLVLDGYAIWNFGSIDKLDPETGALLQEASVLGFAGLAEVAYRYGRTRNDVVAFEGLYTSGDFDLDDAKYGGVATGQLYGVPGAIFGSHRSLLLMPDLRVVNRQFAAVSDISNGGYGLIAGFGNLQYDLIANRLTAKVGTGVAMSSVDVPSTGARYIGTEANAELYYALDTLLIAGLHGGYLWLGDFYGAPETTYVVNDGPVVKPANPWMSYASLTWIAF